MKHGAPKFARSILLIAIMAMIGQAMAVCCAGQRLTPVSTHAMAVMADESTDCHSRFVLHHREDIDQSVPPSENDYDMEGKAYCTHTITALDVDNFKSRTQLNNDVQFDSDVLPSKGFIEPPQTTGLNWKLLSDFRKSHQSTPYYISYCSFLE